MTIYEIEHKILEALEKASVNILAISDFTRKNGEYKVSFVFSAANDNVEVNPYTLCIERKNRVIY